jgi:hypothetical protein
VNYWVLESIKWGVGEITLFFSLDKQKVETQNGCQN